MPRRKTNAPPETNLVNLYRDFKEKAKCDDVAAALLTLASVIQSKPSIDSESADRLASELGSQLSYRLETETLRVEVGGVIETAPHEPDNS